MDVVRNGQARVGVDVLDGAPEPVRYAADALRRFIALRTGCTLPFEPVRGRTIQLRLASDKDTFAAHVTGKGPEAYAVESGNERIRLIGAGPAAVVFAVFDFLGEEVGIGFGGFAPDGVRIAFNPNLRVDVRGRVVAPALQVRGLETVRGEDALDAAGGLSPLHLKRLDWMVQHRLNHVAIPPDVVPGSGDTACLVSEAKRRGLTVQLAMPPLGVGLAQDAAFTAHPEWAPHVNGQRTPNFGPWPVCTSNPDAVHAAAAYLAAQIDAHPGVDMVPLRFELGEGACECDACLALSNRPHDAGSAGHHYNPHKTERFVRFCNEVARYLGTERGGVQVAAWFQGDMLMPYEGMTLEPNVVPFAGPLDVCGRHDPADPACMAHAHLDLLRAWADCCTGRLVVCEPLAGPSGHLAMPWPTVRRTQNRWAAYHDLGIAGALSMSWASASAVQGPLFTGFARLAWALDAPPETFAYPVYYDLYEGAATHVLAFDKVLEAAIEGVERMPDGRPRGCLTGAPDALAATWSDGTVRELEGHLMQAEQAAASDRVRRNLARVRAAMAYWVYARDYFMAATALRLNADAQGDTGAAWIEARRACERVIDLLETMPYKDVVPREMALRQFWMAELRRHCEADEPAVAMAPHPAAHEPEAAPATERD